MLRFIAKRYAKASYVFSQHVEAATNDLNAGLALRTAGEKHKLAAQLTEQADQIDARIKEVEAKLDKGFWECENGHENAIDKVKVDDGWHGHICFTCEKPAKLVKRDLMTGQEKYESDRERADAQKMADEKRAQAKAEEENAANSERTAKYLKALASATRNTADKIRKL